MKPQLKLIKDNGEDTTFIQEVFLIMDETMS